MNLKPIHKSAKSNLSMRAKQYELAMCKRAKYHSVNKFTKVGNIMAIRDLINQLLS